MAAITKKKILQSVAIVLFCIGAIWTGLHSNSVMPFVWHLWYGNSLTWNGIEVELLSKRAYFLPMTKSREAVFIGDWKSRDANIVLYAGNRTSAFQRIWVANFCRVEKCHQMEEQSYMVNGKKIDSFVFTVLDTESNISTFHQYVVIDGGNAWLEFFGNKNRYADHKPTIDSLIQKIVNKRA